MILARNCKLGLRKQGAKTLEHCVGPSSRLKAVSSEVAEAGGRMESLRTEGDWDGGSKAAWLQTWLTLKAEL